MLLSEILKKNGKTCSYALLLSLLFLGACKQNDFYEKDGLKALDGENGDPVPTLTQPTTPNNSTNPSTTTPGTPSVTTETPNTPTTSNPSTPTTPTTPSNPTTTNPLPSIPGLPEIPTTPTLPPIVSNPSTPTTPTVPTIPVLKLEDRTETFTQNLAKDGDIDILWVLDNSGSMADKQRELANNFSTFISHFAEKEVNFKMAITTTDGSNSKNGRMVGDATQLTYDAMLANKSKFISNFTNWAKVGTNGSGFEQGMKCAKSFFDRYSSSFLRKDAYLIIVFVSDEEDQSERTKEEYLSYYQSLKAHPGMIKTYSIVTQVLTPKLMGYTIGTRYNWMADQTSGAKADIYGNFYTTLDNMGVTISNLLDSFALGSNPYNGNVKVSVNGVDMLTGWSLDSQSKTIKFDPTNIPTNGSKIVVTYKTQVN